MSSTWTENDEKPSVITNIKNETTNDDENSSPSTSSKSSSSSTHIKQSLSDNQQQSSILDSIYGESTTLKNMNNLQEQYSSTNGKTINLRIRKYLSFKLDSSSAPGQFVRSDLQQVQLPYPDSLVYYGDGMNESLQHNYSHLQQGKNHIRLKIHFLFL
jgi:hypothetical protein